MKKVTHFSRRHLLPMLPLFLWSAVAGLVVNYPLHAKSSWLGYFYHFFVLRSPILVWFEIQLWTGFLCVWLLLFGTAHLTRKFVFAFCFPLLLSFVVSSKIALLGSVPIWSDYKALQHSHLLLKSIPRDVYLFAFSFFLTGSTAVLVLRHARRKLNPGIAARTRSWTRPNRAALGVNLGLALAIMTTLLSTNVRVGELLSRLYFFSDIQWDQITLPYNYGYSIYFVRQARYALANNKVVLSRNDLDRELSSIRESARPNVKKSPTPSVVVLVLESFIDPMHFNLSFSRDPIPNLRKFATSSDERYALVPVTHGLTAQTGFEVLTGAPLAALPIGQVPFLDGIAGPINSMLRSFRRSGYRTDGFHNGNRENYQRGEVYPRLGFHATHWLEDMDTGERVSNWPDDGMLVDAFLKRLRQDTSPQFLYGLTMMLHGPWDDTAPWPDPIQITFPDSEESYQTKRFTNYVNRLSVVDARLKPLLDYIVASKTIDVAILGDHWPTAAHPFKNSFHPPASIERSLASAGGQSEKLLLPFLVPLYLYQSTHSQKLPDKKVIPAWCILPLMGERAKIQLTPSQVYRTQICRDDYLFHPQYSSVPDKVKNMLSAIVHHSLFSAFELGPKSP